MRMRTSTLGLCGLWALGVSGCAADADLATDAMVPPPPTAADLAGEWHITATGRVYDCDSPADEGRLEPGFGPFRVDATPRAADAAADIASGAEAEAFVRRVRLDEIVLTANISAAVEFKGGGDSEGELHFSIVETLSNDTELRFDFDGEVRDVDRATGTFTGSFPGNCAIKGSFELRRE